MNNFIFINVFTSAEAVQTAIPFMKKLISETSIPIPVPSVLSEAPKAEIVQSKHRNNQKKSQDNLATGNQIQYIQILCDMQNLKYEDVLQQNDVTDVNNFSKADADKIIQKLKDSKNNSENK